MMQYSWAVIPHLIGQHFCIQRCFQICISNCLFTDTIGNILEHNRKYSWTQIDFQILALSTQHFSVQPMNTNTFALK